MKKIWVCMSCIILSIVLLFPGTFATAAEKPSITVESVTVELSDDSITVPVKIANNTGICGATLTITYDEELKLTDVLAGTAFSSLTMTKPGNFDENPVKVLWDGMEADTSNGEILLLTFDNPNKAGLYEIKISYENGEIIDGSLNPVQLNITNGDITVKQPAGEEEKKPEPENVEVNLDVNGGNPLNTSKITVISGQAIGALPIPVRDGYTFKGWFTKKENGDQITEKNVISNNVILYAHWEENPKEHEHEIVIDAAVNATCTKTGLTEGSHCKTCEAVIKKQEVVSALGHLWDAGRVTEETSCNKEGIVTYICERCGETKKEPVNKSGHAWDRTYTVDKKPTCTEAGMKSIHCNQCGAMTDVQTIPPVGHTWNHEAYVVTVQPTVFTEGQKERTCTACGKKEVQKISKLKPTAKLNTGSIVLQVKQTTTKVTVSGLAKGDKIKSWKSSNTRIVKVSNKGKIVAQNKTGTARITITLASGKTVSLKVKVQRGAVKTTKISGVAKTINLKKGKRITLKPVITPITSVEKITYLSSNKKVATVSNKGVVTGKKQGKAKITIKSGTKKLVVTINVK